jgi:hypothetical protein
MEIFTKIYSIIIDCFFQYDTMFALKIILLSIFIVNILLVIFRINDFLKLLIYFEISLLLITVIFLLNLSERIDDIVILFLVVLGGESALLLSIIFPFILTNQNL